VSLAHVTVTEAALGAALAAATAAGVFVFLGMFASG